MPWNILVKKLFVLVNLTNFGPYVHGEACFFIPSGPVVQGQVAEHVFIAAAIRHWSVGYQPSSPVGLSDGREFVVGCRMRHPACSGPPPSLRSRPAGVLVCMYCVDRLVTQAYRTTERHLVDDDPARQRSPRRTVDPCRQKTYSATATVNHISSDTACDL